MKRAYLIKYISVFLLLSMLSHTTYLHDYLENYVLCYGVDGHVAIENVDDCSDCSIISTLIIPIGASQYSKIFSANEDCQDFSLNSECFEENEFLIVNKTAKSYSSSISLLELPRLNQKSISSGIINSSEISNLILQNYTTVLLII